MRAATLRDPGRGTIRLAFLHSIAAWLAPEVLRGYRTHAPGVTFDLTQDDGMAWIGLHREQLCLAVPADHPLTDREKVGLADAGGEPFVTLREPIGLRRLTDDLCARAGVTPRIAFESTEIGTLEGLVAAGTIGLAWLRGRPRPPVVARFAAFVTARFPLDQVASRS